MDQPRLPPPQPPSLLGKLVAVVAFGALLIAALAFSVLLFAVGATVGLAVVAWLWWKTRALRRQLREHPPGGHVVEGEAVVLRERPAEREPAN